MAVLRKSVAYYFVCVALAGILMILLVLNRVTVDDSEAAYYFDLWDDFEAENVSGKRYMLPLRIPEQLTMSTVHFHQFLNLVNDWNFTGVEPFAYGSTTYGLRSLNAQDLPSFLPFHRLFNSTLHNDYLSKCMKREPDPGIGSPVLFEPISKFLRYSYKRIVLVYFAGHFKSPDVLTDPVCEQVNEEIEKFTNPFVDCSVAAKKHGMFGRVEQLLSKEVEIEMSYNSYSVINMTRRHFKVVQAFCVKPRVEISLLDLKEFVLSRIRKRSPQDAQLPRVSIVFITWQGRFTQPLVQSDVSNYINKCRLPFSQPFHSDYVKNATNLYLKSRNFGGLPYLSLHIRFEKLYLFAGKKGKNLDEYMDCCMKRLRSLLPLVMHRFNITKGNILLNWDFSPYGTIGCPNNCHNFTDKQLSTIDAKPSYFDPEQFGFPSHRGLVSLIEMETLLGGKALVTVGEGSYQYTIINSFIKLHNDLDDTHYGHLCIPEEQLNDIPASSLYNNNNYCS